MGLIPYLSNHDSSGKEDRFFAGRIYCHLFT